MSLSDQDVAADPVHAMCRAGIACAVAPARRTHSATAASWLHWRQGTCIEEGA